MKRWFIFALLSLMLFALAVRFAPLMIYEIWGSDTGEYYALTLHIVNNGYFNRNYNGWGFGYPYFPGMFIISSSFSIISGIDTLKSIIYLIPFFGAFSCILLSLLCMRITNNEWCAMLSGLFISTATAHAYATSHPMPGTIGDALMITMFLLYIGFREKKEGYISLVVITPALIITHHLSTFFFMLPLISIVFFRELLSKKWNKGIAVDVFFITYIFFMTISYWIFYAKPFPERVMNEAFGIPYYYLIITFIVILIIIPSILKLRKAHLPDTVYIPRIYSISRSFNVFLIYIVISILILFVSSTTGIPGTNIKIPLISLFLFFPGIFFIGLAIVGVGCVEHFRRGVYILAWIIFIALFFMICSASGTHVFLPYRIAQFATEVIAILVTIGLYYIMKIGAIGYKKIALATIILIILSLPSSYPPRDIMGGFEEGIYHYEMDGVRWVGTNINEESTVATDHRMSSMIFGFTGINCSWDDAYYTLHGNLEEAMNEMKGLTIPSGYKSIDYVFIDDVIKSGVALEQWENAKPMNNESLEKFDSRYYTLIYCSESVQIYRTVY